MSCSLFPPCSLPPLCVAAVQTLSKGHWRTRSTHTQRSRARKREQHCFQSKGLNLWEMIGALSFREANLTCNQSLQDTRKIKVSFLLIHGVQIEIRWDEATFIVTDISVKWRSLKKEYKSIEPFNRPMISNTETTANTPTHTPQVFHSDEAPWKLSFCAVLRWEGAVLASTSTASTEHCHYKALREAKLQQS